MRLLVIPCAIIVFFVSALSILALEIENRMLFGPTDVEPLRVISTTDIDIVSPLINSFLSQNKNVAIDYVSASSRDVMKAAMDEAQNFDVALSSAMDLQTKLANDGYTLRHMSSATALLPNWAEWRNHVFAFSEEPASIVIFNKAFEGEEVTQTRQELITLLRNNPERFRNKTGTYDVSKSGLGYLFATQDARAAETYWRLMELMGGLGTKLYCCSSEMIEQVANGEIFIAYNVLGSYARARADLADEITIIDPKDYTHLMMRSAVLLKQGSKHELAAKFVDFLIDAAWREPQLATYPFAKLSMDERGAASSQRPIELGPGLLVYLDSQKRKRFLREWENTLRPPAAR